MKTSIILAAFICLGVFVNTKIKDANFCFQNFQKEMMEEASMDIALEIQSQSTRLSSLSNQNVHTLSVIIHFVKVAFIPIMIVVFLMWGMMTLGVFSAVKKSN